MKERFEKQLAFITLVDRMKTVLRQTLLIDRSRRENDAEHSWHLALIALVLREYADESVDVSRVIKMALVHDLVEVYAGDTFAYDVDANRDKEAREREAADRVFGLLPDDQAGELRALWDEFEAMETPDSKYANACDRLQPMINNYKTEGHTWKLGGGVTSAQVYTRMGIIQTAMPELWPFIEHVIAWGLEMGYLRS